MFLLLFSLGDHTAHSRQTPISTVLFTLPPKESPKFLTLCLSFLKQAIEPKETANNQGSVSSAVGSLTTEAALLLRVAAPALLHGREGRGVDNSCVVPLMLEVLPTLPREKLKCFSCLVVREAESQEGFAL